MGFEIGDIVILSGDFTHLTSDTVDDLLSCKKFKIIRRIEHEDGNNDMDLYDIVYLDGRLKSKMDFGYFGKRFKKQKMNIKISELIE